MKAINTYLALAIMLFFAACKKEHQKAENAVIVPEAILQAFTVEYPEAKHAEWEKDEKNFEVAFEENGFEKEITYDLNGKVVEMEVEIDESDLPQGITAYINTKYSEAEIIESEKEMSDEGTLYKVELIVNGEEISVTFDGSGNFLEANNDEDEHGDNEEDDENED